jgi:Fe-S-cluster containining protein
VPQPDDQRYEQLLAELTSNPGYAEGRRAFPRTLTPYDALILTGTLHADADRGGEARAASARSRGLHIACREGCNACCQQPVRVFLPEAIRIAEWLKLPENATVKQAFLEAYPAWRERVGDGFDRIAACKTDDERLAAHLEQWQKRVMCAFNREGSCTIYPVRPLPCRSAHALDSDERCRPERYQGELPRAHPFAPLDKFVEYAQTVDRAMHHALGGERNRKRALCQAVHELLQSDRYAARRG